MSDGSQTLRYDITGDASGAVKGFKDTAESATVAARAARELGAQLATQSKSAQASAQATLAMVKASDLLDEAEKHLGVSVEEAAGALREEGNAAADAAAKLKAASDVAKQAAADQKKARDDLAGNAKGVGIAAALVEGIAVSPALLAGGALIGGVLAGGIAAYASSPALKAAGKSLVGSLESEVESAAQPLVDPIGRAIAQVATDAHGLAPELKAAFSDAAPAVQPLVAGLESLGGHALPGVLTLMRDGQPAVQAFGEFLGDAGTGAGKFLTSVSAGVGPASAELRNAGQVVESVLGATGPLLTAAATDARPLADALSATAAAAGKLIAATPAPVLDAIVGSIGGAVLATKALGVAEGAVATLTGEGFLADGVAALKTFKAATDGASLAEKGLLAAEVAVDAVSPAGWATLAVAGIAAATYAAVHYSTGLVDVTKQQAGFIAQMEKQAGATGYSVGAYQQLAQQQQQVSSAYARQEQAAKGAGNAQQQFFDAIAAGVSAGNASKITQQYTAMAGNLDIVQSRFHVTQDAAEQLATAAGVSAQQLATAGSAGKAAAGKVIIYGDAVAKANDPTSALAGDLATLSDNALSATTQLNAFNDLQQRLVGNTVSSQAAVLSDTQAFQTLQSTITQNGRSSTAAQQAYVSYVQQVLSSTSALMQNHASVQQVNDAFATNISRLKSLHDLTPAQRQDLQGLVATYDDWARSTQGLSGKTIGLAGAIEGNLIGALKAAHADTPAVNADIGNLANTILKTGNNSTATAAARAQLIADLRHAGDTAAQARQWVQDLQDQIDHLTSKSVVVAVQAESSGTVTYSSTGQGTPGFPIVKGSLAFRAAGGAVGGTGGPTQDNHLIAASTGEWVINASSVKGL